MYQNESLSKYIMLLFDMYLQLYVWYSGGGAIGLSDKNEIYTLDDLNSTHYFVLIKIW